MAIRAALVHYNTPSKSGSTTVLIFGEETAEAALVRKEKRFKPNDNTCKITGIQPLLLSHVSLGDLSVEDFMRMMQTLG